MFLDGFAYCIDTLNILSDQPSEQQPTQTNVIASCSCLVIGEPCSCAQCDTFTLSHQVYSWAVGEAHPNSYIASIINNNGGFEREVAGMERALSVDYPGAQLTGNCLLIRYERR